jgi:hypothetical protein
MEVPSDVRVEQQRQCHKCQDCNDFNNLNNFTRELLQDGLRSKSMGGESLGPPVDRAPASRLGKADSLPRWADTGALEASRAGPGQFPCIHSVLHSSSWTLTI